MEHFSVGPGHSLISFLQTFQFSTWSTLQSTGETYCQNIWNYLQRKCINQCFMYLVKFDWPGTELFVGHFPTTRRTTFPRDWAVQGRDENGNFRNLVSSLFYEYLYILVLTLIMLSQGFVKGEEFCWSFCEFFLSYL